MSAFPNSPWLVKDGIVLPDTENRMLRRTVLVTQTINTLTQQGQRPERNDEWGELMANGYSRSPKLLKGALIQFSAPMLIPIPNIIIFQYNPETMTRTLEPWKPLERAYTYRDTGERSEPAGLSGQQINALAQPFYPQETFLLTLELDAADALEHLDTHPVATLAVVADRIAAIEMLCYPPGQGAIGGLLNVSLTGDFGGAPESVINRKHSSITHRFQRGRADPAVPSRGWHIYPSDWPSEALLR